jgi:hypothetical protein
VVYLDGTTAQVYLRSWLRTRPLEAVPRAALADALRDAKRWPARIDWLFGSSLCRFAPLPANARVRNQEEATVVAATFLEHRLGLSSRDWMVAVEPLWRSRTPLACAVRKSDLAYARAVCESLSLRCGHIRPWLGLALRHAPRMGRNAAILFDESDALTAVTITPDGWQILTAAASTGEAAAQRTTLGRSLGLAGTDPVHMARDAMRPVGLVRIGQSQTP